MATTLWPAASSNAFSTTVNGSINDTVSTIALTSVTGLNTTGGVLAIDRQDGSGNNTPTKREFITYTAISGSNLTGVTRGVAGSTAQSHNSGALVEETMSVTHWNDLVSYLQAEHDTTGKHVISTATISTHLQASGASVVMSDVRVQRYLNVSGASIVGSFPIAPVWVMAGFISGTTTSVGRPLIMPQGGNWSWFSFVTPWVASGASVVFDVKRNGTSIFAGVTFPTIVGGGTFVSTASISTKTYAQGDIVTVDVKSQDNPGIIRDVTALARGY